MRYRRQIERVHKGLILHQPYDCLHQGTSQDKEVAKSKALPLSERLQIHIAVDRVRRLAKPSLQSVSHGQSVAPTAIAGKQRTDLKSTFLLTLNTVNSLDDPLDLCHVFRENAICFLLRQR